MRDEGRKVSLLAFQITPIMINLQHYLISSTKISDNPSWTIAPYS